jgi:ATP-dependent DNA helicase 2 subunit 2
MYSRVLEEMRVLREEMSDVEEPGVWNKWLRGLKEKIFAGELGGGREELWWKVRKEGLGLVSKGESSVSDVTDEEAKQFLASK